MVASEGRDIALESQALALLSAARAQVSELDRALAGSRDSRLAAARGQAMDAVGQIKAAMHSGDLTHGINSGGLSRERQYRGRCLIISG
jgi:chorismate mutase